jgi:4-amino-4-deoxychorismate lyase
VQDGVPLWIRDHVARLRRSAAALGLGAVPAAALRDLPEAAARLAKAAGSRDARCRLVWAPPFVEIDIEPLEPLAAPGVSCVFASWRRDGESPVWRHKTLSWLENRIALREAARAGAFDALFADGAGRVLEGARSNVFAVTGGTATTPPLSAPILPGTARARVAHLLRRLGVRVREAALEFGGLARAEEAFLTNALRGVVPLVRLGRERIGSGAPGPVSRAAGEAFERACDREAARARRAILRTSDRSS